MKLALIQHKCQLDIAENINLISKQIEVAAQAGANLILLQELHNSVYFCQQEVTDNFDLAETIPGSSTEHYSQLAKQYNLVIVTSLFEKRAKGLYHNTAVVLDTDGSIAGKYRKMHIPDDPGFYEKYYFTPGDLGFEPITTSIGKLGVLICWDQWYPEAARIMALKGADILLYPTAIGWDLNDDDAEQQRQLNAWITIQRSHAVSNGLYMASCNRTGFEVEAADSSTGINFWGNSFIAGPQGEVISQASNDKAEIIYADIDFNQTEKVRRVWPYLRDRRIDNYKDILKRYID
ncbi:MAG: carbon-nitrogen hydrolase [Gammaproteobacteria bacterium]|nr:carbon-nitrogen hydrolase [Gammaproteobacteria bacterium]MCW8910263.1 carbon-nitrogen hydrolase [Gammaproteobacteria bacterium]MCW9006035.1 carbon-nitrogen hydrolase [Gammaproteobacteria bacterium]MCW9055724.1 carbon-nitrogen hydrolase [Gammaproteobacteria bacterium]